MKNDWADPTYVVSPGRVETPAPPPIEWKCPRCGTRANDHTGAKDINNHCVGKTLGACMGLICECPNDTSEVHGTTMADRCPEANCYHCGWSGKFPKTPKGLAPWEKKAIEAGWTPPAGRLT